MWQYLLLHYSTTGSYFQTNVFPQTFLQHCSAICLELSASICSELWLWHYLKLDSKLIFSLLLLANWLDLSASASEAIAQRRSTNRVLLLLLLSLLLFLSPWTALCENSWSDFPETLHCYGLQLREDHVQLWLDPIQNGRMAGCHCSFSLYCIA